MLEELTDEQTDIMWQIYLVGCNARGDEPTPDGFLKWLDERN